MLSVKYRITYSLSYTLTGQQESQRSIKIGLHDISGPSYNPNREYPSLFQAINKYSEDELTISQPNQGALLRKKCINISDLRISLLIHSYWITDVILTRSRQITSPVI